MRFKYLSGAVSRLLASKTSDPASISLDLSNMATGNALSPGRCVRTLAPYSRLAQNFASPHALPTRRIGTKPRSFTTADCHPFVRKVNY